VRARPRADSEITNSASAFKAKCLELFKRLEQGKLKRITVIRRGRPVASVARAGSLKKASFDEIYGCMRGTIEFAPDYDPFEQVIDEPSDPFLDKKTRRDGTSLERANRHARRTHSCVRASWARAGDRLLTAASPAALCMIQPLSTRKKRRSIPSPQDSPQMRGERGGDVRPPPLYILCTGRDEGIDHVRWQAVVLGA
jgi:hypothetical protein